MDYRKLVTEPVRTEDMKFATAAGVVRARLYLAGAASGCSGAGGAAWRASSGDREPRLENFAAAMASCGLRVLTPELPDIKDYHVDLDSVHVIGESAQWFAGQTGGPVGVMGLSFSGGLALVAAADPVYRPDFKFVLAVGSQDGWRVRSTT